MWKKPGRIKSFSIVHQYIQHFNEVSGNKSAVLRKRSRLPGVVITQFVTSIPEGQSTPDFQCKPAPATVEEGETAVFRVRVKGDPKPDVSWKRTKGAISENETFQTTYNESTGEHVLKIRRVSAAEEDTYKCFVVNKYGRAVCSAKLTVAGASTDPVDFRKLLRKSAAAKAEEEQTRPTDGRTEKAFWDAMLNADSRDYKHICAQFGVEDTDLIVMKVEAKKRESEQNKCLDGVIPYNEEKTATLNQINAGRSAGLMSQTGESTAETERFQMNGDSDGHDGSFLPECKLSNVEFVVKIEEVKAQESEEALFECVLTHPVSNITWMGNGSVIQDGAKYSVNVSDHQLIHRLMVRDCQQEDRGIYSAVVGKRTCSAWLLVEAERDPASAGEKAARKASVAGGARVDLEKAAQQQQIKLQEQMERILTSVKATHEKKHGKRSDDSQRKPEVTTSNGTGPEHQAHMGSAQTMLNKGTAPSMPDHDGEDIPGEKISSGSGQNKVMADGSEISARSVSNAISPGSATAPTVRENKVFTGSSEGNQDPALSTDGKKVPTGSVSRNNICSGSLVNNGVSAGHAGGNKDCAAPDDDRKDPTGSADGEKDKCQRQSRKVREKQAAMDANECDEASNFDGDEKDEKVLPAETLDSVNEKESGEKTSRTPARGQSQEEVDEDEETESAAGSIRRKRQGPLTEDTVIDPGVHFICGLSDVDAVVNEAAELMCKLSSEDCEGVWFKEGRKIPPDDQFCIIREGAVHKLIITKCKEEHSGKYRFVADGRKTEAMINVKDPPRFRPEDVCVFTEPVKVRAGQNAMFKMPFIGQEPIRIQWYREGEELLGDNNVKVEKCRSQSRLLLSRCQRKDTGEIKIKLKNQHGVTEAISQLIVLDKPTPPLGPAETTESSATCVEFKWRPPKDDGGSPVTHYLMERQQVGRNTWKKLGEIPGVPRHRDTDVEHGRKYCYRIWAVTAEGTSEMMETDEMQAGTLAFPGPPAPPAVVSAFDDCINIAWEAPSNRGGSRILGYLVEKRKKGSNLWSTINATDDLIKEKKCAVRDVVSGMEYEFRVTAVNLSGVGECSSPSEFVFARDPKKPPGKVVGLKVSETSYTHFVLTWTKPEEKPGIQDEAKGYFIDVRQADCIEWSRCNTSPLITTSFSVRGLKHMDMYWARVTATNDGGDGPPEELQKYITAMPRPVRPKFTNHKMKSFMVVKAGNSVRIMMHFEASPLPDIMWLKDNVPVTKRVTISNSDSSSQLLIPSSERSDSGVYSVLVKNLAGQETFSIEVRVTDDPRPPGPIEVEENVPGTVTLTWLPSPDEKLDDRLHYTVSKLDSTKGTWATVADRLFNNRFTVCNTMHGRVYHFRVYAKNDMGISPPSESPTWGTEKKKERFALSTPAHRDRDMQCPPVFIVPLKLHNAPKGYECYMSCAVTGNPKPRITWYRNHVSLNTDTNYYISNTCGVCSLLILRVGPKDMGEYTITAESTQGRAECSTVLSVRE
ncbi:immunoglobulin-like and fibronectin type III domain-containing protein 1 [Takifugu rubripes]|uniref:immunoglobulin-like and fibronectin type III domain-containing protein 1 n=1 Tax=Takifugu rubripes TaxID=31033 RepID=UPI00114568AD|nr:immunoglobulin-like and fibronectin type III domain-containing protein 1 [Takifugu rubripes]